jgi:multiple sugar transport system ATP-binding protein
VFQSYALYPTMTVERNMSFGLRVGGTPRADIERRVGEAARMLQLTELLQRKPSQLSGGQRQRVAIGRALVRDAAVFLFDEPLSNLDAQLRAELRRELKQLHKNIGKTMIYVTHDQVEAMTLATRIVIMRKGKMLQIDTPQRVYDEPANLFVAGFIGSPPMNFIRGRLERSGTGLRFVSPALSVDLAGYPFTRAPLPGAEVVLGVRPEHLSLCEPAVAHGRATVSLVEPMGAKQLLWLDMAGSAVAIELDAQATVGLNDQVGLSVDVRRVSVFDAGTEQRC